MNGLTYGSMCSGIEAATVAWKPLGWRASFFSEIEPFPNALLEHHYPDVPNRGDMNRFKEWPDAALDVLVAGTPCQTFSVAGLRKGLDDPRGNLTLVYLAAAAKFRSRWLVWENVPGVLSIDGGRAFGAFLGGLAKLGYGFAYRVLDAQFFGVPQRRRRVFVVAHLGSWRRAAAVLFECASLRGDIAPRREEGERVAPTIESRADAGGAACGTDFLAGGGLAAADEYIPDVAKCLETTNHDYSRADGFNMLAVRPDQVLAFDTTQATHPANHSAPKPGDPCHPLARGGHAPTIAFSCKDSGQDASDDCAPTLRGMQEVDGNANGGGQVAVAFESRYARNGRGKPDEVVPPLKAQSGQSGKGDGAPLVAFADVTDPVAANQARTYTREGTHNFRVSNVAHSGMQVRRLTPRECERLQGFRDDYTLLPYGPRRKRIEAEELDYIRRTMPGLPAAEARRLAKDGPRYRALGNSMAVPVMRWIGERIAFVDALQVEAVAA